LIFILDFRSINIVDGYIRPDLVREIPKDNLFQWELYHLSIPHDNELCAEIHRIFLEGFGLQKGWGIDGIKKRLINATVLTLLLERERTPKRLFGYGIYSIPPKAFGNAYLLWEDFVCLTKSHQRIGLSKYPIKMVWEYFSSKAFGWIGGRTQNPAVFKRYASFGQLFPFNFPFQEEKGKELMDFICSYVQEIMEDTQKLDRNTGLFKAIYSEGKLGDYSIEVPGTERYEMHLQGIYFDRYNGDAQICIAEI